MNDRRLHVMNTAHQLFIEKGYLATSIQDILEYSGISKGTFYNYFASKNDLLIALLNMLYKKIEKERDELLIGQEPANIEVFIEQLQLQMEMNRTNGLTDLFEEVIYQNDEDLKKLIKLRHISLLQWTFQRFIDIFGEDKRPYLLDCAVMFMGILNSNIKYYSIAYGTNANLEKAVVYSVERISKVVWETTEARDQLINPEIFAEWLPHFDKEKKSFKQKLRKHILLLKKSVKTRKDQTKWTELLDFIQEELLHTKNPRKHLIQSVLSTLETEEIPQDKKELQNLKELIENYFLQNGIEY